MIFFGVHIASDLDGRVCGALPLSESCLTLPDNYPQDVLVTHVFYRLNRPEHPTPNPPPVRPYPKTLTEPQREWVRALLADVKEFMADVRPLLKAARWQRMDGYLNKITI